jgi:pseudouridylate synthase I
MNYLLVLEYDGTPFSGWQKQPGARTVQEELEKAAKTLFKTDVRVTGAGRTDKGVHALGQAANLSCGAALAPDRIITSLNALLPAEISIISVKRVREDLNARFAAVKKIYEYRIWNKPARSVWAANGSWHVRSPLDVKMMRRAAGELLGRHDFSAFDASGGTQQNKIVNMKSIKVQRAKGYIVCTLEADRFLYKMVRSIVGTLVESGRGERSSENIRKTLVSRDRRNAGRTAPAKGLYLKRVYY